MAFGESSSAAGTGYAIPIEDALAIASRIEAGKASDTVVIGTHGFLGVELQSAAASNGFGSGFGSGYGYGYGQSEDSSAPSGAVVTGVVEGGAASTAGWALQPASRIAAVAPRYRLFFGLFMAPPAMI